MIGRTHDLAAITALLAIVFIVSPTHNFSLATLLVALLANQIGGILPDIDQPTAPLWRNLPIGRLFGRAFDSLLGGHRFLTHSLLGVTLFGSLAWLLLNFIQPLMSTVDIQLVWWAFLIGILSHLVMDSFTKEGVPWLLPIPWKIGLPPTKSLRLTAGKSVETLVVFPSLIIIVVWLCASHYSYLLELFQRHLI
ncbi:MAG: metal-dependent hydrolase [Candidatus Saccharibacteria bacterium]